MKILCVKFNGVKFKVEKGINFLIIDLGISGFMVKDKEDLVFVVEYVDVVNFFFVNLVVDVEVFLVELK